MTMEPTMEPDRPPRLMVFRAPCVPAEAATSTFPAVLASAFARLPFVIRITLAASREDRLRTPLLTVTRPAPRESAPAKVTVPVPESVVEPVNPVLPAASVISPAVSITREPAPERDPAQALPSPSRAVAPPAMESAPRKVFAPVSSNVPAFTDTVLPAVPLMTPP